MRVNTACELTTALYIFFLFFFLVRNQNTNIIFRGQLYAKQMPGDGSLWTERKFHTAVPAPLRAVKFCFWFYFEPQRIAVHTSYHILTCICSHLSICIPLSIRQLLNWANSRWTQLPHGHWTQYECMCFVYVRNGCYEQFSVCQIQRLVQMRLMVSHILRSVNNKQTCCWWTRFRFVQQSFAISNFRRRKKWFGVLADGEEKKLLSNFHAPCSLQSMDQLGIRPSTRRQCAEC